MVGKKKVEDLLVNTNPDTASFFYYLPSDSLNDIQVVLISSIVDLIASQIELNYEVLPNTIRLDFKLGNITKSINLPILSAENNSDTYIDNNFIFDNSSTINNGNIITISFNNESIIDNNFIVSN